MHGFLKEMAVAWKKQKIFYHEEKNPKSHLSPDRMQWHQKTEKASF